MLRPARSSAARKPARRSRKSTRRGAARWWPARSATPASWRSSRRSTLSSYAATSFRRSRSCKRCAAREDEWSCWCRSDEGARCRPPPGAPRSRRLRRATSSTSRSRPSAPTARGCSSSTSDCSARRALHPASSASTARSSASAATTPAGERLHRPLGLRRQCLQPGPALPQLRPRLPGGEPRRNRRGGGRLLPGPDDQPGSRQDLGERRPLPAGERGRGDDDGRAGGKRGPLRAARHDDQRSQLPGLGRRHHPAQHRQPRDVVAGLLQHLDHRRRDHLPGLRLALAPAKQRLDPARATSSSTASTSTTGSRRRASTSSACRSWAATGSRSATRSSKTAAPATAASARPPICTCRPTARRS